MEAEFVSLASGLRLPFPPQWSVRPPSAAAALAEMDDAPPVVVFTDAWGVGGMGGTTPSSPGSAAAGRVTIALYSEATELDLRGYCRQHVKRVLNAHAHVEDVDGESDLRQVRVADKLGLAMLTDHPAFHFSYGVGGAAPVAWAPDLPEAAAQHSPEAPPRVGTAASGAGEGDLDSQFTGTASTIALGSSLRIPAEARPGSARVYTRGAVVGPAALLLKVWMDDAPPQLLEAYVAEYIEPLAARLQVWKPVPPSPADDPPESPHTPVSSAKPSAVDAAYAAARVTVTDTVSGIKIELPHLPLRLRSYPAPPYHVPTPSGPIPTERAGSLLFLEVEMDVGPWEAAHASGVAAPAAMAAAQEAGYAAGGEHEPVPLEAFGGDVPPARPHSEPIRFQIEVEHLRQAGLPRTLTLAMYSEAKLQQRADCSLYTLFKSTKALPAVAAQGRAAHACSFSCHAHDIDWTQTSPTRAQSVALLSDGKGYSLVYLAPLHHGQYEAHLPWFHRFLEELRVLPKGGRGQVGAPVSAQTSEDMLQAAFPLPSVEDQRHVQAYRKAMRIAAGALPPEAAVVLPAHELSAPEDEADAGPTHDDSDDEFVDVKDVAHIMNRYRPSSAVSSDDEESEEEEEAPSDPAEPPATATPDPGQPQSLRALYEQTCKRLKCKPNSNLVKKLPLDPALNETVQEVDVSVNYFGPTGLQALLLVLEAMPKVDTLHLNDMALDNEDVQNVAAAAAKHPTLTHVNLSNNPKVSLMSARAVLGLVAENPNIRRLELHGTHVGEDVMKKIEEQLQQNAARQTAAS